MCGAWFGFLACSVVGFGLVLICCLYLFAGWLLHVYVCGLLVGFAGLVV